MASRRMTSARSSSEHCQDITSTVCTRLTLREIETFAKTGREEQDTPEAACNHSSAWDCGSYHHLGGRSECSRGRSECSNGLPVSVNSAPRLAALETPPRRPSKVATPVLVLPLPMPRIG